MLWAVAVLLTTRPSKKLDGWTARSVKVETQCEAGPTLCAILVLQATVRRYGNVAEADFVAMIDEGSRDADALRANGVVVVEMDFEGFHVFDDYLLMRKFYIFKLQYDRALLLDSDAILVGSVRHLFLGEAVCGGELADECWSETDRSAICVAGSKALVVAQQTPGTPVLTAFMVVTPSRSAWTSVATALTALCGGSKLCNRRSVYENGWNASAAPHDWALRLGRSKTQRRHAGSRTWRGMGAGFTDQGFAEYYFAQHRRALYSISHRTCKLRYVHFNMPPKPWFCPGEHCQRHRGEGDDDLMWGGHKCAADWWWQFSLAAPSIAPSGCVATCLARLNSMQATRRIRLNFSSYRPRCKDWNPDWPILRDFTKGESRGETDSSAFLVPR